ncbi:MAG TPA: hypothetical protein VHO68_07740 [Bacteroidales bacterium]|nr:hypothetical protein [Bacteroidales bacterium]
MLDVWLCDTDEDEEPDLVWSKELKESDLLGSGKNSKSLVDCEKETSHHSVYTKPRSVTMKCYEEWLLNEVQKPVIAPFWVRAMRALKSINESGGS